jgi:hypothetical protein
MRRQFSEDRGVKAPFFNAPKAQAWQFPRLFGSAIYSKFIFMEALSALRG